MSTSPAPSIALLPGGRIDLSSHADGIVIEKLALHRSDEGTYWAAASRSLNLTRLLAPALEHLGSGEPETLNRYERLIGDFFQQRYGAELTGETWDSECAEFSAPVSGIRDAATTLQAAWFTTDILKLNEDIRYGRLASLIASRIKDSVCVADRRTAFGTGMRMSDAQVTEMVNARYGSAPITDGCAVAIARRLTTEGSFPGLRALAAAGYADFDSITGDLEEVRSLPGTGSFMRRRADMLAGWASETRAAA